MDLYTLFLEKQDIRNYIFSFLKYSNQEDDTYLKIRLLSKEFSLLPVIEHVTIEREQSLARLKRLFRRNPVRSVYICQHNRHLYKIEPSLLSSVRELRLYDLPSRDARICLNFFSRFSLKSFDLGCVDMILPDSLLRLDSLINLRITITKKENEALVFQLLRQNSSSLRDLDISFYTREDINTVELCSILESKHMRLETLYTRPDLFTYFMIRPTMRSLRMCIPFVATEYSRMVDLIHLHVEKLTNNDVSILCSHLQKIQSLSLYGEETNIPFLTKSADYADRSLIRVPDYLSLHEKRYDGSIVEVNLQSPFLRRLSLSMFTVSRLRLIDPTRLKHLELNDVSLQHPVHLPQLTELTIENTILDPRHVFIRNIIAPRVSTLDLSRCRLQHPFSFHRLQRLTLNYCILSLYFTRFLKKQKRLHMLLINDTLFDHYMDYKSVETLSQANKIQLTLMNNRCIDEELGIEANMFGTVELN